MSEAHTPGGTSPPLPPGAAPDDHPGWRLLFLLVSLGCGGSGSTSGWAVYIRITVWMIVFSALLGGIVWLAGPWFGLGAGGLYGATKAGKAVHRAIVTKRPAG